MVAVPQMASDHQQSLCAQIQCEITLLNDAFVTCHFINCRPQGLLLLFGPEIVILIEAEGFCLRIKKFCFGYSYVCPFIC